MLDDVLIGLGEYTGTTLLLFVAFFFGVGALLTRRRFPEFLGALGQAFATFFIAPVRYLHASVRELPREMAKAEGAEGNRQYLLQQMHFILHASLLVLVLVIFAGALAAGWHAMIPSKSARDAYSSAASARTEAESRVRELEQAGPDPRQVWASEAAGSALSRELQEVRSRGRVSQDSVTMLTSQFARATGDTLPGDVFGRLGSIRTTDAIEAFRRTVEEDIRWAQTTSMSAYPQAQLNQLRRWVESWASFQIEFMHFSEALASELTEAREDLEQADLNLRSAAENRRWRPVALLLSSIVGLATSIALVWLFGLILESTWLGVDVATNLRTVARASRSTSSQTGD